MIRKAEEAVQQDIKIRMLIAGFPGIGKTTLALSAPAPLHIDVDSGVTRIQAQHRKDYIQPNHYEELLADLTPGNLTDYQTLVFDTGGRLLELMKPWAIKQSSANGQSNGTLSLKGYGAVGREFNRLMDFAYYELKKHVVVLFHAKEERDDDATRLRILVEGATKDNVWQPMDLGGFMEMNGKKRTIGFSNCERYFAKGTHGVNGIWEIPDVSDAPNDFLSNLFAKVQENVRQEAAIYGSAKTEYDAVMARLRPMVENMTVEEIDAVTKAIKGTPHALTSEKELKALFSARLKAIGLRWDKEAKQYAPILDDRKPA